LKKNVYFENISFLSKPVFFQQLLKVEKPTPEPFPYYTLLTKVEKYIKAIKIMILVLAIDDKLDTKV